MKTTVTLLALILQQTPALAGVAVTRETFWQTVYQNNYAVTVGNADQELKIACTQFDTQVWNSDGEMQIPRAGLMEQVRQAPLAGTMASSFAVDLKTNLRGPLPLTDYSDYLSQLSKKDALPGFTKAAGEVSVSEVDLPKKQILISAQSKSLQEISRSFGLRDLPASFVVKPDGIYLHFAGKDTLCDFLAGRAYFATDVLANVKILLKDQINLTNFYKGVSDIGTKATEVKNSRTRIALLAFRLGNLLAADKDTAPEQVESRILNLLDSFFTDDIRSPSDKVELNRFWADGPNNTKVLSVPGTALNQPLHLQITYNKENL